MVVVIINEVPLSINTLRTKVTQVIRKYWSGYVEVKMRSSMRVPGIQLADIVAGYLREKHIQKLEKD